MELESKDDGFCDDISLLSDPDMTQESLASDSSPSLLDLDKTSSVDDEEDEARPLGQIPKQNRKYNKNHNKSPPGVILLGRGNSFSLGRSEVIVLNRKHNWTSGTCADDNAPSVNCDNGVEVNNNKMVDPLHVSTPPPVSNGGSEEFSLPQNDLDLLWAKAETVMFARQEAVQRVLEDFGIGEAGGRGEDNQDLEEENVWQVVQENFQV